MTSPNALPTYIDNNQIYYYVQLKRNGKIAMYQAHYRRDNKPAYLEVIIIQIQKPRLKRVNGISFTTTYTEKYPTNSQFGAAAWAFIDMEHAEIKYYELLIRQLSPPKPGRPKKL